MDKMVPKWVLIRCAVLLSLLYATDTVRGQGNGDYDEDYFVDGDDFASWGACMTTPGAENVPIWSPCGAFDFDVDWDVDLLDFGAFQAAFQKPAGGSCTGFASDVATTSGGRQEGVRSAEEKPGRSARHC